MDFDWQNFIGSFDYLAAIFGPKWLLDRDPDKRNAALERLYLDLKTLVTAETWDLVCSQVTALDYATPADLLRLAKALPENQAQSAQKLGAAYRPYDVPRLPPAGEDDYELRAGWARIRRVLAYQATQPKLGTRQRDSGDHKPELIDYSKPLSGSNPRARWTETMAQLWDNPPTADEIARIGTGLPTGKNEALRGENRGGSESGFSDLGSAWEGLG